MNHHPQIPMAFWDELERNVSSRVNDTLNIGEVSREQLISYLRDLEIMARTACDRRQTVQIIASARSVLGDQTQVGPREGPFTYAVA